MNLPSLVTIWFGGVIIYAVAQRKSLPAIGALIIFWVLLAALAWGNDDWIKRFLVTATCWFSLHTFFLMINGAAPVFIIIMWLILGISAYLIFVDKNITNN